MVTGRDQGVALTILIMAMMAEKKIETDESVRVVVALIDELPPVGRGEEMAMIGRHQVVVPIVKAVSDLGLSHQKNKSL